MTTNSSPWIHQLDKEREIRKLGKDIETDVAIVGAGIAGISTAFFILKNTNKKVVIVDAYKLAHGATGHNAGQITSYFEKPFSDIVKEFGLKMASDGQRFLEEEAWMYLNEMYSDAGLSIPLSRFVGHAGLSRKEQVFTHLEENYLRKEGNLKPEEFLISEEVDFIAEIPGKYEALYSVVPHQEILTRLETFDPQYIAVMSSQKGAMNSALFCQEVARYLFAKYEKRIHLYEHTPIIKVVLKEGSVLLDAETHTIEAEQVVLCTNGFENIEIFAPTGLSIDTRFHHNIGGVVGFMSGFLEEFKDPPTALSYYRGVELDVASILSDPYFYVTRRQYEYEKNRTHNLVCVGGPDFQLEHRNNYAMDFDYPENAQDQIDDFIRQTYDKPKDLEYAFMWHGLMGYTANMIRMVGCDPEHKRLLYNLGCNGVGILPSIYGGERISKILKGEKLEKSIFDITTRPIPAAFPEPQPV